MEENFKNLGILEYLYNKNITKDKEYKETKERILNKIRIACEKS